MWQEYKFENIPELELKYKSDAENFCVVCSCESKSLAGASIFVCSGDASLNLGSLSKNEIGCGLSKTYPLAYVLSSGIDVANISCFFVEEYLKEKPLPMSTEDDDPSVVRARELLNSFKNFPTNPLECQSHIACVKKTLNNYQKSNLNIMAGFEFYKIDDIKESFSLSSVSHITHTAGFMQCFAVSGCWFFGVCDSKDLFAICIEAYESCSNPMANAMDCVSVIQNGNSVYCIVGIELCDDGQYFCKLIE